MEKICNFEITQDNIDAGIRQAASLCPVHLAFEPQGMDVVVTPGLLVWMLDEKTAQGFAKCPAVLEKWILDYDAGKLVKPGKFIVKFEGDRT